ncbi:EamA family transporter [Agarivorans sp. MS3-6]|uniref:EamA family transporter n=1 Tax=Agarivorans sp. TSD2052 TaxID=2937286 RepID=UPI0020102A9D|nr:EamA family transporter [Agarivorans sp. TSD2052]UPW18934.1 EamA family transporter [Agarivorans sp. TSD2052]
MISWLLVIASISCSSLSQYWQKRAALLFTAEPNLSTRQKLLCKPLLLGIIFLGLGAVFWLGVLSQWDVSVAYPLLSSNFVIMLLVSKWVFNEDVSRRQWLGVAFIVLGVAILGGVSQWF